MLQGAGAMAAARRPMYTDSAAESVASEVSELLGYPDEAASADRSRDGGGIGSGSGSGRGSAPVSGAATVASLPATLLAGSQTLVDRLDSAHYEPRPPGLLERQDSAHQVGDMSKSFSKIWAGSSNGSVKFENLL